MFQILIKKALPHITAFVVFLIINISFFSAQLQNKVVQQGDNVQWESMSKELIDYRDATGSPGLWTNAMFGGMPSYQISAPTSDSKLHYLSNLFGLWFQFPIGLFNTLMIGGYLLLIIMGVNPWLSIIGAIAFGFTSNNFILYEAGHNTKLLAVAYSPLIIAGVLLTFRKKFLVGGLLFAVGMTLNIYANHFQMTYYLGICIGILIVIKAIAFIKKKDWVGLVKVAGVLSLGLFMGIGPSFSNLWRTYEYSKETMRGTPILIADASENNLSQSSSQVEGLNREYATSWSNSILDLGATFIAGMVGGSSNEEISQDSHVAQDIRRKGAQINRAPLYWGALPFTSGPAYFGALIIFLFIFSLFLVKGSIKWWFATAVILTMALSMGKHLSFFTNLFFDYFPMYNKFRAPSSILSITAVFVPIFGIYGISEMVKGKFSKQEILRCLKVAGGILGGFSLLLALLGPSLFDFSNPGDATYQQRGFDITAIINDRKALLRADAFRTFLLVVLGSGMIWAYINEKIKSNVLYLGLGLLTLIDLWTIGKRYIGTDSFISQSTYKQTSHVLRPIDQQIYDAENIVYTPDSDKPLSSINNLGRGGYRVFDMSINTYNSAATSYFHNTVGGYHAAKLQRFQDLIDWHLLKGNIQVLNMLNAKYFITREQQLQSNPNALGNAWFVSQIKKVNTPNEEIKTLSNFNAKEEAVVLDQEFNNYVGDFVPQKNGNINMTNYYPDHLTYQYNTSSPQFAVFSEIWYGPDKGWNAYLDGEKVEHIRANYALRGMKLPAGQHTVEFKFEPKSYYIGERVSAASSIVIILLILGYITYQTYLLIKKTNLHPVNIKEEGVRIEKTKARKKRKAKK